VKSPILQVNSEEKETSREPLYVIWHDNDFDFALWVYENSCLKEKKRVILRQRTRPQREGMRGAFTQLKTGMEEWKKQFEANPKAREFSANVPSRGETITLDQVNKYLENFDEEHSVSILSNLSEVAQIIFDMKWSVQRDPEARFVTSDDPFVLLRPASIKKYGPNAIGSRPGLLFKDVELTLPLSSEQFPLAGWILENNTYLPAEDIMVRQINHRTITHSSDRVITKSKKDAESIRDRYTETKDKS